MGRIGELFQKRYEEELAACGRRPARKERKEIAQRVRQEVARFRRHEVVKGPIYENFQVLSPRGELMFRCERGRFQWYLKNTPTELVSENPPILRLLFEPQGHGFAGEEDGYNLRERANRCVVCGLEEELLARHHVLPSCFRRFYPRTYIRRNQHDVVPICLHCHGAYEVQAAELKQRIAQELDVPMGVPRRIHAPGMFAVVGYARVLLKHREMLPAGKREWMEGAVRKHLGTELTEDTLEQLAARSGLVPNPHYRDFGEAVVARVGDQQKFLERWRRHFLETMRPKYMPEGWDVARSMAHDVESQWKPWRWEIYRARKAAGAATNAPWWTFMSEEVSEMLPTMLPTRRSGRRERGRGRRSDDDEGATPSMAVGPAAQTVENSGA